MLELAEAAFRCFAVALIDVSIIVRIQEADYILTLLLRVLQASQATRARRPRCDMSCTLSQFSYH